MNNINMSFKGYMPVEFYAKHPKKDMYVPVVKPENIRKCGNFVVRNLNHTAKTAQNDEFVQRYKEVDKDYRKIPVARNVYDRSAPIITSLDEPLPFYTYIVTGQHVDTINKLGRNLGIEKADIFEKTGEKNNEQIKEAQKKYQSSLKQFMQKICPRVLNEDDERVVMQVYFDPKYTKSRKLKGFEYKDVNFYSEKTN